MSQPKTISQKIYHRTGIILGAVTAVFLPLVTRATGHIVVPVRPVNNVFELIIRIADIIAAIIPVLIGFAVFFTIYSIVRYIIAGNENEKRQGAVSTVWSIIAIVAILSVWWLVNIVTASVGARTGGTVPLNSLPSIPVPTP